MHPHREKRGKRTNGKREKDREMWYKIVIFVIKKKERKTFRIQNQSGFK